MSDELAIVPVIPNDYMIDAMNIMAEVMLSTVNKLDVSLIYGTGVQAASCLNIPHPREDELEAENARLREALGEICKLSNPDWAEARADMAHTLDTIHIGAVNVYYGKALEAERRYEKNT